MSPSKNNVNVSRLGVRFADEPCVVEIETISEEEERACLWYTKKDFDSLRAECDDEFSKEIRAQHRNFVISLLAQQTQHRTMGVQDAKGLSQLSKACSKASKKRAIQLAKETEKEVNKKEELVNTIDEVLGMLLPDEF